MGGFCYFWKEVGLLILVCGVLVGLGGWFVGRGWEGGICVEGIVGWVCGEGFVKD